MLYKGAIVGTPFDLALIRMQVDNSMPEEKRMRYRCLTA
jgi:hypothetical protein